MPHVALHAGDAQRDRPGLSSEDLADRVPLDPVADAGPRPRLRAGLSCAPPCWLLGALGAAGRAGLACGHLADELPDPLHAVDGGFGMITELLGHPGGAAAHAELAYG